MSSGKELSLLLDIPYEIFTDSILDFLTILDILRLGETCHYLRTVTTDQSFWRRRAFNTFRRLPPQPIRQEGWHEMYKRLSTAKVFTWGSNEWGRLGHSCDESATTYAARYVTAPVEVERLRHETVVDLKCGGWSMWALTSSGKVEGDLFFGKPRGIPRIVDFPENIDRIMVGRRSCLALAGSGQIYTVDHDFNNVTSLSLDIVDTNHKLPEARYPLAHMAAGWSRAAAVFKGIGLMVWLSDLSDAQHHGILLNPDSPPLRQRVSKARRIFRTEDTGDIDKDPGLEIVGLMVGDAYLVYLTRSGTVHRVNITNEALGPASHPQSFQLTQFVASPQLCYLSGSFNHFGLFNTAGDVLIGSTETGPDSPPETIPLLQRRGVIELSWGDWHTLALCDDGSILSWGRELYNNGCLGMGYKSLNEARSMGLTVLRGSVTSDIPRRIPSFAGDGQDKFAFLVAAGGWHSGALVADF